MNDRKDGYVAKKRYVIMLYGIVQGVGFRPFIYRTAQKYKICGWARNTGGGVIIDCLGSQEEIRNFLLEVVTNSPKLAWIERVECIPKKVNVKWNMDYRDSFYIKESLIDNENMIFVSPDIAVCSNCLEDMKVRGANRYQYAFTNCTECGPRYTIIKNTPYDRHNITMDNFPMCDNCKTEYNNPGSRRFHAQPNCCSKCGPRLILLDRYGVEVICDDPVKVAKRLLREGNIMAIKGLGGFHLSCDAGSKYAIELLRIRKHRRDKPLAIMARDMEAIKKICQVSEKEEAVLRSSQGPIVLLRKKIDIQLPEEIAPKRNRIGIMLPYTPLHHLLMEEQPELLVMTSGNISERPMEYKNEDAIKHLSLIADYYLVHNRDIHIPIDDSVVKIIEGETIVSRRARGYAPYSTKVNTSHQIIAVGADQKSTFCFSRNGYATLSQYLGDLGEMECMRNYRNVFWHLIKLYDINAKNIACDFHPGYLSTEFAGTLQGEKMVIQHHHAHMVSCMAEHDLHKNVVGIIFDGTGYGLDGAIWGGEIFIGNRSSFRRVGQLEYVTLQGGNQAVKEPWRCALSYLHALDMNNEIRWRAMGIEIEKAEGIKTALNAGVNCFLSSSIGRLFDAVAAFTGIRHENTYDGQAAIELENKVENSKEYSRATPERGLGTNLNKYRKGNPDEYIWNVKEKDGLLLLTYRGIIEGVVYDMENKVEVSKIATKFHNTLVSETIALVEKLRDKNNINQVVLSGGVFENQYILLKLKQNLIKRKFEVFYHKEIPTNDGGISFGQLHAAVAILEESEIDIEKE